MASCRLHNLNTDSYFEAMIRVVPCWPRDRYLELAPKYWLRTWLRLDAKQLALPIGPNMVPPRNNSLHRANPTSKHANLADHEPSVENLPPYRAYQSY